MRQARIKLPATEGQAVYHCISRSVNGERLFDDVAKEIMRRQLWQVADYCGVQIITYALMSNHVHILVRVPRQQPLSDIELLRRYNVLYPKPTTYQVARLEVIKAELTQNGPEAVLWRRRQVALMGDVSQFMKLLKQRFSIWYNKTHGRFGTLWAERFKSVLVEVDNRILGIVAAYIDLNCVRAGLVNDPKDYRFCGYAAAVAGNTLAQSGIRSLFDGEPWHTVQAHYRETLFGAGASPRDSRSSIPFPHYKRVIADAGELSLACLLRCRVRYFTEGAVLGGRIFVAAQMRKHREKTGRRKPTQPRGIPSLVNWGDWATWRAVRQRPTG